MMDPRKLRVGIAPIGALATFIAAAIILLTPIGMVTYGPNCPESPCTLPLITAKCSSPIGALWNPPPDRYRGEGDCQSVALSRIRSASLILVAAAIVLIPLAFWRRPRKMPLAYP